MIEDCPVVPATTFRNVTAIAAIRFRDGEPVDRLFATVVTTLRVGAAHIDGILQEKNNNCDGCCATMRLRNIADGSLVQISQDRGRHGRGCRLDTSALADVAGRLERAVEAGVDLLIVNRFGRAESEGHGLRAVIEQAALGGVPVLIGVRDEYVDAWDAFHGGTATALPLDEAAVLAWCHTILGIPPTAIEGRDSVTLGD